MIGVGDEEEVRFDWRRGGAAVAGLFAALVLVAMIFLVKFANDARERALAAERHTYEISLVVRNVSANISRAEAALARFVLDEEVRGSGNIYASDWQLAGYQIDQLRGMVRGSPEQLRRVDELKRLYQKRGDELSLAARAALARQGDAGISYFYQAAKSGTGTRLDNELEDIIRAERESLRNRIEVSQIVSEQASRRSDYLNVIGIIVGLGAIFLGVVAVQALRQFAAARRQVESEAERAEQLEYAVRERTQELWEANQALKAEAHEREAAEAQLRQVQKMEAVGQLTGGIAHDFNNILTVITGTIEILADAVKGEPQLAAITRMIDEAASRGADLTQHLLAFARKQPLEPKITDVNTLIIDTAKLLQRTLGEHVEIESVFDDETCPAIVDPNQLATAILNLALNARDAMPDGGKLIIETGFVILDDNYARMHSDVRPGRYAMIAVSDTGTGIPAAILDKVFNPFFTSKGPGKGTGLGLSMVYGFVKQSAGHIMIYSEEGHGTTIKMYLPPATGALPAAEPVLAPAVEGGRETILVVEDDTLVRNYVLTQLHSLGYVTLDAANATEAIALAHTGHPFDLLFTDVIMPGMNGRQLADEILKVKPGLRVLFTSGYTENAIIHHGRLDEGVLLLAKPYRKSDMAIMIRKALAD